MARRREHYKWSLEYVLAVLVRRRQVSREFDKNIQTELTCSHHDLVLEE